MAPNYQKMPTFHRAYPLRVFQAEQPNPFVFTDHFTTGARNKYQAMLGCVYSVDECQFDRLIL